MSEEIASPRVSMFRKLRQTPFRDLVRGRLSGRLDWRGRIESSTLPVEAKTLILNVIKRTRLWKLERYQLADELIAHFADGIESGESATELVRNFGDERTAASLIRRAKIRNRPLAWHGFKWARRGVVVLLVFYAGLAVYFFVGKPTVSVDYVAKLNAPVLAVPESDRAWPIYRQAAVVLARDHMPDANWPNDAKWPEVVTWLRRNQASIQLLRAGAEKSAMGVPFSRTLDPADREWVEALDSDGKLGSPTTAPVVDGVIGVRLRHLGMSRYFANTLAAEAVLALDERDAVRCEADLVAQLQLARQLTGQGFLVSDLTAVGIRALALSSVAFVLQRDASVLSDDALRGLAHELNDVSRSSDLISLTGERYTFYDMIQRSFTDDGRGDGRFTSDGIRGVVGLRSSDFLGTTRLTDKPALATRRDALEVAFGPASLLVMASRRELLAEYDRLMNAQEARLHYNLRDVIAGRTPVEDINAHVRQLNEGTLTWIKFALVAVLAPAFDRLPVTGERALGQQEGVKVAIALELYRRANGSYPQALQELTPRYLQGVPADRISGDALRYKLKDGKPLIYSVGVDRDDDGGRMPLRNGEPDPWSAAEWSTPAGKTPVDGDWVLYPVDF